MGCSSDGAAAGRRAPSPSRTALRGRGRDVPRRAAARPRRPGRALAARVRLADPARDDLGRDPLPHGGGASRSAEGQPGAEARPRRGGGPRALEDRPRSRRARRRRSCGRAPDRGDRARDAARPVDGLSPPGDGGRTDPLTARRGRARPGVRDGRRAQRVLLRVRAQGLRARHRPRGGDPAGALRTRTAAGAAARGRSAGDRAPARRPDAGQHPRRRRRSRARRDRPGAMPRRPGVRRGRPRALARAGRADHHGTRGAARSRDRCGRRTSRRLVRGIRSDDRPRDRGRIEQRGRRRRSSPTSRLPSCERKGVRHPEAATKTSAPERPRRSRDRGRGCRTACPYSGRRADRCRRDPGPARSRPPGRAE